MLVTVLVVAGRPAGAADADGTDDGSSRGAGHDMTGMAGTDGDGHGSGHDMPGMVEPSEAAFVPDERALDPDGWTASAGTPSADDGTVFSSAPTAVDGDRDTIWRAPTEDVTSLTVDLGDPRAVSSLTYVPPSDGRGAITRFLVETSPDGVDWRTVADGRWATDHDTETAEFALSAVRFVRLTALAVDGGVPAAASELELNTPVESGLPSSPVPDQEPGGPDAPADGPPSQAGRWGRTISFPLTPAAGALLPGNRLLTWSAFASDHYQPQGEGHTQTAILDLDTMRVEARDVANTHHDMFCPGTVVLADGRVMVAGGSNAVKTSIYDPRTDEWTESDPMNVGRGYNAMTLMADGRAFTVGGSWGDEAGTSTDKVGEVWSESNGWRALSGVPVEKMLTDDDDGIFRQDNHMWLYAVSDDEVLQLGPSRDMNLVSLDGNGSVTTVGTRPGIDQMNGNAVMYARDRVLVLGGAAHYDQSPSTGDTFTIDTSDPTSLEAKPSGELNEPRSFVNSVVLPDGEVVAIGGQSVPLPFDDTASSYRPEIWNPRTGQWRLGAPMSVPRNYHSIAVLLPDGRIFSGGGGLCGEPGCAADHPNGQIYTPGYLLKKNGHLRDRPSISKAPRTTRPGRKIVVRADSDVRRFAMVRNASATHSVDNDQRRVPLEVLDRSGGRFALRIPRDPGIALPGEYMLFALDKHGTPSVSKPLDVRTR